MPYKEAFIACPTLSEAFFLTSVSMTTRSLFLGLADLTPLVPNDVVCLHFPVKQFSLLKTLLMHGHSGCEG